MPPAWNSWALSSSELRPAWTQSKLWGSEIGLCQLQSKGYVRSFLGFCNYYRSFVQDFLELAIPLNALTKKGVEFRWGPGEQHAFDQLKLHITRKLTLAHPRLEEPFELEASGNAMGAILLQ